MGKPYPVPEVRYISGVPGCAFRTRELREADRIPRVRRGRRGGRGVILQIAVALCLLFLSAGAAQASVSLLLEQPYGGLRIYNPTGHSALYFDHICAATPVELRPCGPGELGVVISRYDGIEDYDWVAVPLIPYLYGVDSAKDIPGRVDRLTVLRIRDMYRRQHLQLVAPDTDTGGMPQGNWYQLVGSAYDRAIYGFRVRTTPEQDAGIIALFNDRPNVTHYSGAFRNCADFARSTINLVYPHAVRRDFIADFGLTTPKSVARALTHYAHKHPEAGLEVFQVRQVRGDLPRSIGVEGVTESLLKRYAVPMVVVSPHFAAAVLVAYIGHGRFEVPKDAPTLDLAAMEVAASAASARASADSAATGTAAAFGSGRASADRTPGGAGASYFGLWGGSSSGFISRIDCPECTREDLP